MKIINSKSVILTSLTVLLMGMSVTTQAKIYKWTDAKGQTHYTAQPPAEKKLLKKAKNIEDEIKSKAGKYRVSKDTTKVASNNTEENKAEEKLSGPSAQLIKYCDGQRKNLRQLKKTFKNVWIDTKGKKTTLSQEQRKEKVSMLANKIKTDCSEVPASAQKVVDN